MKAGAAMEPEALYHDPELVRFYDPLHGKARADFDFCAGLAEEAASVLDLGCGTGQLAAHLAEGGRRQVTGVDPAAAMLDVGHRHPGLVGRQAT
jgi:2-polyprenyl-3-methyl-5-hydroxy-6-metoxy-1,4-benzoquinol methylase